MPKGLDCAINLSGVGFLDQNRFDSYRIATSSKIGSLDEAHEIAATVLERLNRIGRKRSSHSRISPWLNLVEQRYR
jgi:hypothetical protein